MSRTFPVFVETLSFSAAIRQFTRSFQLWADTARTTQRLVEQALESTPLLAPGSAFTMIISKLGFINWPSIRVLTLPSSAGRDGQGRGWRKHVGRAGRVCSGGAGVQPTLGTNCWAGRVISHFSYLKPGAEQLHALQTIHQIITLFCRRTFWCKTD